MIHLKCLHGVSFIIIKRQFKTKSAKGWGYGSGGKALAARDEPWSLDHQSPQRSQADVAAAYSHSLGKQRRGARRGSGG